MTKLINLLIGVHARVVLEALNDYQNWEYRECTIQYKGKIELWTGNGWTFIKDKRNQVGFNLIEKIAIWRKLGESRSMYLSDYINSIKEKE